MKRHSLPPGARALVAFIGMEQEAIGQITAWIQAPKP